VAQKKSGTSLYIVCITNTWKANVTYIYDNCHYKDQLSLTNPRDALHHGERAGGRAQCDALAIELS